MAVWRPAGCALAVLVVPLGVEAQATGTPSFMAPPPPQFVSSVGFFGTNGNRGNGFAFEAEYRFVPRSRRFDFGLRAGVADAANVRGSIVLAGLDARYSIYHETMAFPLDAAVTAGYGTRFGRGTRISLAPVGVTFGRRLTPPSGALLVTTYMHPKVFYISGAGDDRVGFNMGVGLNLLFARGFEFRIGGSAGDFGGFGIGFILFRPFPPQTPEVSGGGAGRGR